MAIRFLRNLALAAAASISPLAATVAAADMPRPADGARRAIAACQDAVVSLRISRGSAVAAGNDQRGFGGEYSQEVTGVVVGAEGLTMLSLTAAGLGGMGGPIRMRMNGNDVEVPGNAPQAQPRHRIAFITSAGEIPADIVLRDQELEWMAVRPSAPWKAAPRPIELSAESASAATLDAVFALQRTGRAVDRIIAAQPGAIAAVLPQGGWLLDRGLAGSQGCPIFAGDGSLLGVAAQRRAPAPAAGQSARSWESPVTVIHPLAVVRSFVERAKTAKPEEAAPAPGAPEAKPDSAKPGGTASF